MNATDDVPGVPHPSTDEVPGDPGPAAGGAPGDPPPTAGEQRIVRPVLSSTPLYLQVEEQLARLIESGQWPPGARVPSEGELCESFGVSRVTVRQALARLVTRGMITRGRGKGTFVRDRQLTAGARSVSSFSTELTDLGIKPGSRLLEAIRTQAGQEVAAALERPVGTSVYRVRRLRAGDGKPMAVQTSWLVADLMPGLPDHLAPDTSLYTLIAQRYGVIPTEAVEVFRVTGVPRDLVDLLEVARGAHAFHVTRVTYTTRGTFEYTTSVIRGDRYRIRLALRNA